MFVLDKRLREDTVDVACLRLCMVRLMKNRSFPWIILVPMREGLSEIYELSESDRRELIEEAAYASSALKELYCADKINIGALGNQVPQLHIHVIARFRTDPAWPGPVWGRGISEPYTEADLESARSNLRSLFERKYPL